MLISFFNDVDTQLILELKNSFEKYDPVFPKNPYSALFFWHPIYYYKDSLLARFISL